MVAAVVGDPNDDPECEDWETRRREQAEFAKREWGSEIRRNLVRQGCSVADVPDVEQETYRRLMGPNTYPPREPAELRLYVFSAANSALIDLHRSRKGESSLDTGTESDTPELCDHDTPEEYAIAGETLSRLQIALVNLTTRRRDVLWRHLKCGESYADIAAELNIAEATVKKVYGKALAKLREAVKKGEES
jgi:RNA polymerase sigma factor (sigma-70 family)